MSTLQASGFGEIPPVGGIADDDSTRKYELGTVISDTLGNSYRYVKASAALAQGMAVTSVVKAAWDTTVVVDGTVNTASDTNKLHVDTVASDTDANEYRGYYVSQTAAAGKGFGNRIAYHDAIDISESTDADIYFEDLIGEAFADGEVLYAYHPNVVEPVNAATEIVMGIAVGTITINQYGFIQVGGHCPAVLVGGTTNLAVVLNEALFPGATVATDMLAGALMGGPAATSDTAIFAMAATPVIALQAVGANTAGYVEAFIQGLV